MAIPDVCSPWISELDITLLYPTTDSGQLGSAVDYASYVLFMLSGKQFPGVCTEIWRPGAVHNPYRATDDSTYFDPGQVSVWLNTHLYGSPCYHSLQMPNGPVTGITEIKIDGVVIDEDTYRVDSYGMLVREDGQAWPCWQNLNLPPDELGTWSIEYTYGTLPPEAGRRAAIALAVEINKALCGKACALPERVSTVTRQGITMTFIDPLDFLDNGRTGITLVDLFLKTVNPNKLVEKPRVYNPDNFVTGTRQTWPA